MPDQRRGGKKAKSERQDTKENSKVTPLPYQIYVTHSHEEQLIVLLAFFFACIAVLCYQYLEYWTGLSLGSPSRIEEHDEDHNTFIVVDIPGKGKGIVATRDIKVLVMQDQI